MPTESTSHFCYLVSTKEQVSEDRVAVTREPLQPQGKTGSCTSKKSMSRDQPQEAVTLQAEESRRHSPVPSKRGALPQGEAQEGVLGVTPRQQLSAEASLDAHQAQPPLLMAWPCLERVTS